MLMMQADKEITTNANIIIMEIQKCIGLCVFVMSFPPFSLSRPFFKPVLMLQSKNDAKIKKKTLREISRVNDSCWCQY